MLKVFVLILTILLLILQVNSQITLNSNSFNDIEQQIVLNNEANKTRVVFRQAGQWADIQKQMDNFYWQQADSAYSLATQNNFIVEWDIVLQPQSYPQWIKNFSQEQKKLRLLNFIKRICNRYNQISIFSVQANDINEGNILGHKISNYCSNKKIQIKTFNNIDVTRKLYNVENNLQNIHLNQQSNSNQLYHQNDILIAENYDIGNSRLLINSAPIASLSQVTLLGYTLNVRSTSTDPDTDDTIAQVQWDWDDQTTHGSLTSDSHIYKKAGTFTVKLMVQDNNGAWSVTAATLTVTVPTAKPVARFTTSVTRQSVSFDGRTSSSTYGKVDSWEWTYGDTHTQTTLVGTATHKYASSGAYTASLVVKDDKGAVSTPTPYALNLQANLLPIASFNVISIVGYTVYVQSTSTDRDSDGYIAQYDWNFGDGKQHGDTQSSSHIYGLAVTDPTQYTISLTVTDQNGGIASLSQKVTIPTNLPVAKFNATVNKLSVAFDASDSYSVLGTIKKYSWDFGDGKTVQDKSPTEKKFTYVYDTAGEKTVILTLYDDRDLVNMITKKITTVANALPVADFKYTRTGKSVTVISNSTDSDGQIKQWQWSFGDSTANQTTSTVTHNYVTSGSYTITLTVKDDNGAKSTKTVQLNANDPPIVSLSATAQGYQVTASQSSSDPDGGSIASKQFTWGDSSSAGSSSIHTYTSAGIYTISFVATDSDGLSTTKTTKVSVPNPLPTATFTVSANRMTVTVDGSQSTFTHSSISNYIWDWGDGQSSTQSTPTAAHTYSISGIYFITLKVSDSKGAISKGVQKSVLVYFGQDNQKVACWKWQYLLTRKVINSEDNFLYLSKASYYDGSMVKNHFFGKSSISI